MADIWKTEYHVIGQDGDAFAWFDDDEEQAIIHAKQENAIRIDAVTYYHNDTETVWEAPPPRNTIGRNNMSELPIVTRLRALHVWPQFVADEHAEVILPRQSKGLYEVGEVATEAADRITELADALREIIPTNVCDNPNVPDELNFPCDITMGELRKAWAALAKAALAAAALHLKGVDDKLDSR